MLLPLVGRAARRKAVVSLSPLTSPSPTYGQCSRIALLQQRSYSSKPSDPSNGKSGSIPTPEDAAAKSSTPVTRKRQYTRSAKSRSKHSKTSGPFPPYNVPSVPSTQHLNRPDVHLASLFALHRPISVRNPLPSSTSLSDFSSIFSSNRTTSQPRTIGIIITFPEILQDGSGGSGGGAGVSISQNEGHALPDAAQIEGAAGAPVINFEEIAKKFRPFHPPPPPVPMPELPSALDGMVVHIMPDENGNIPPIMEGFSEEVVNLGSASDLTRGASDMGRQSVSGQHHPPRQPFLERMQARHQAWEEARIEKHGHELVWLAISVRRQRKLKMKKHKYKKLMRRTRNLRRKLDRV